MPVPKGYKQSEEHKRKRAAAWVGRRHAPESRAKMSASAKHRARPRAADHPSWVADEATYTAMHLRIKQDRGAASDHACIDCGGSAAHWSLATERAQRVVERHGRTYSLSTEDYDPRCVSCHRLHDQVAA